MYREDKLKTTCNTDSKRRLLINGSWAVPTMAVVSLPSHAQATETPTPPVTPPVTPPGDPLLYISSVLSNPVGGDCGPDARETVTLSNAGTAPADLSGLAIQRVVFFSAQTIASLTGSIPAGESLVVDVCDGTTAGDSAVLNNQNGGIIQLVNSGDTIDTVTYPTATNDSGQGNAVNYDATPSTSTPRSPQ